MKNINRVLSFVALLLTSACTQVGLFAANAPTAFNDVQVTRDVAFGAEPTAKLDIYTPADAKNGPLDVIVFFYGGRWSSGHKEDYRFVGSALAKKGFVVVIPDYRKYPQVKFPGFIEDAAMAVAWTYDHIDAYGGRRDRINVSGHSAGAHIGALVTADPSYLKALGKERDDVIQRFAGLAGPYDFIPEDADLKDMFGPPEKYPQMQVPTFITGHEPPMLLLYGDADIDVGRFNLDQLQDKIKEKGGAVESIIYPGIDHVWIVASLAWFGQHRAPVAQDMAAFLKP